MMEERDRARSGEKGSAEIVRNRGRDVVLCVVLGRPSINEVRWYSNLTPALGLTEDCCNTTLALPSSNPIKVHSFRNMFSSLLCDAVNYCLVLLSC